MDAAGRLTLIRELCSFEGRWPGTDAERRAANFLAARLRRDGRRAEVEPTHVHPEYSLVVSLHLAIAIAGSVAAIAVPPLGFALVLIAATSLYWDLNARRYLLRRLFFRRTSQNVLSPGSRPDAPSRLVLSAHYDAARTGAAFSPKRVERAARLQRRLPFPLGPFRVLFWAMAALLPILGARMAGIEANWLSALQLLPTLILVAALLPLLDIALSPIAPGANDNASGVATVLSLAAELDRDPPANLDVWILLTGGEECLAEGMRAFLRSHGDELDPARTRFLNLDTVGIGTVAYQVAQGPVLSFGMDERLIELCEAVATADRERGGGYSARASRWGLIDDALPPQLAGHAAITLRCLDDRDHPPNRHTPEDTPDRIDPAALDRAHAFSLELIRALDRDVGRRAGAVI